MAKKNKTKKVASAASQGLDKNLKNINKRPIDDRCEGCERVEEISGSKYCTKYAEPAFHWEDDQICSFATHIKREIKVVKKIVNPLKASKRAAGKKG